jgi:hypothetical protein
MAMRLERLKIKAFSDEEFKTQDGEDFTVWLNPESYNRTLKIESTNPQAIGASGTTPQFKNVGQEKIVLKLIFDTTGLVPSPLGSETMPEDGVAALIEPLIDKIAKVPAKGTRPNFVQLSWAQLQARCVLESMSIDYKLFRPDGTPIRAVCDLSFKTFASAVTLSRTAKLESKQAEQLVTVLEGDTLPGICFRIYGDSTMYLDVAQYNQLTSFRKLTPGSQLRIPPRSGGG